MGCKHRKVEGNTTKYFVCKIFNKAVDDYKCKDCMMKIEDKNEQLNDIFKQIFGKGIDDLGNL